MNHAALGVLLVLCSGAPAFADEREDWVRSAIARAAAFQSEASLRIQFETRSLRKASQREMTELRARVEGLPAHPDRVRLGELERIEERGEDVRVHTLWWDKGRFRLSRHAAVDPEISYSESVDVGDSGWTMTPQHLYILGPFETRPRAHSVRISGTSAMYEFESLAFPMLSDLAKAKDLAVETNQPARWRAAGTIQTPVGERFIVVAGSWSEERRAGLVERADVFLPANRSTPASTVMVSKHEWIDPLGSFIGSEATTIEDGTPTRRATLISVTPLDAAEFRSIVRTPAIDGTDPIRGKVTFTQYNDYRGRVPSIAAMNENGRFDPVQFENTPGGRWASTLRWLGWLSAAGIVCLLVVLKMKRNQVP